MKEKKIIVTGGAGYIGRNILISLIENNYIPIVIDNLSNSDIFDLRAIENFTNKKIVFHKQDITNKKKLIDVFYTIKKAYAVIHLASLKSISESIKNPNLYIENNILGTINLITAMNKIGCKKLIFSSSCSVYESDKTLPLSEVSNKCFKNPYSDSKLLIENILESFSNHNKDWNICVLRYFNPVGAHVSGLIGGQLSKKNFSLFDNINKILSGKEKKLTVYKSQNRNISISPIRDYIHITDLAEANIAILKKITQFSFIIFNIGSGKGHTVLDIIEAFKTNLNIEIPYILKKPRIGDDSYSVANIKLIKNKVNWKPRLKIDDICLDYYKWVQSINKGNE